MVEYAFWCDLVVAIKHGFDFRTHAHWTQIMSSLFSCIGIFATVLSAFIATTVKGITLQNTG